MVLIPKNRSIPLLIICVLIFVFVWYLSDSSNQIGSQRSTLDSKNKKSKAKKIKAWIDYPWIKDERGELQVLSKVFSPPTGFSRVKVIPKSFTAWLRKLPVAPLDLSSGQAIVRAYNGKILDRPAARIIPLDVGKYNLQQCADSAIRLHAEYQKRSNPTNDIAYHFTSGDLTTWKGWLTGDRFFVLRSFVLRISGPSRTPHDQTWRDWLELVFRYAGTRSLAFDTMEVKLGQPLKGGDIFVSPGSPGHAVVLLDVAENPQGHRVALIGQGFMPAEDFHVLKDTGSHVVDGVWFLLPPTTGGLLETPLWQFSRIQARRFPK